MATFKGVVTAISAKQTGTSKTGKQWSKVDVVLTYDNYKPEYPKAILFSVMNDNIDKFAFRVGAEFEVEIDFSVKEFNGKHYMSAQCWKSTPTSAPAQPVQAPVQAPVQTTPPPVTQPVKEGDLPF